MNLTRFVIVGVLGCVTLNLFTDEIAHRRRAETIARADRLFGQHYTPIAGKSLRSYDKQTETGSPDRIIYWYGSGYVIEMVFAADGTVASLGLLPEGLLYTDTWSEIPSTAELSHADMQWLISGANRLQALGRPQHIMQAPDGCFQSGQNIYCTDSYELASVSHYHVEHFDEKQETKLALKDVAIVYRQVVVGVVEDVRLEGSQRHLKVAGHWYHGEKPGTPIFANAHSGDAVRLVTHGCAANEKSCIVDPEESGPLSTEE